VYGFRLQNRSCQPLLEEPSVWHRSTWASHMCSFCGSQGGCVCPSWWRVGSCECGLDPVGFRPVFF
jgi:hypothetical protein